MPSRLTSISAICPIHTANSGISGCAIALCDWIPPETPIRYWTNTVAKDVERRAYLRQSLPNVVLGRFHQFGVPQWIDKILDFRYTRDLDKQTVAWLWPGITQELVPKVKARAGLCVIEQVNAAHNTAQRIMDDLARRHGRPEAPADEMAVRAARERRLYDAADYVFACSPFVADSLLAEGFAEKQILRTSYGWDPKLFQVPVRASYEAEKPVFLFVGADSVRKGIVELLMAWERVKPNARLRIAGTLPDWVKERFGQVLARPEVETVGYVNDLSTLYRESDVFVLPTHEEGSPLVTYLAMAAGLPSLVSYPGTGGVVVDDQTGLVRDPYDLDALADGLARLARDASLRERLGRRARADSPNYTWEAVGKQRGAQLARLMA